MLLVIGWIPLLLLISRSGVPALSENVNAARVAFFPNGYYATCINVGLISALVLAGMSVYQSTRTGQPKARYWFLAAVAAIGLAVPGGRGTVAIPLLTIILVISWDVRLRLRRLAVGGLLAFCALSFLGYQRLFNSFGTAFDNDLRAEGYGPFTKFLAPGLRYLAGTSETFDRTIQVFPRFVEFQLGEQFFGPLLLRPSADLYLKEVFGLTFEGRGLALGIQNAFYLDWGIPGIGIGMVAFGIASGYLHALAIRSGGLWALGYILWLSQLVLSNYAHPFAYLSTLVIPTVVLLTVRYWQRGPSLPVVTAVKPSAVNR